MALRQAGSVRCAALDGAGTVWVDMPGCSADTEVLLFTGGPEGPGARPRVAEIRDGGFRIALDGAGPRDPETTIDWVALDPGGRMLSSETVAAHGSSPPAPAMPAAPAPEMSLDDAFFEAIRQAAGQGPLRPQDGISAPAAAVASGQAPRDDGPATEPAPPDDASGIDDWLAAYVTDHDAFDSASAVADTDPVKDIADAPCFTAGTRITTLLGQIDVARLRAGAFLLTRDHGFRMLREMREIVLSAERLATRPDLAPVEIRAHALGEGRPAVDMQVSPGHHLMLTGPLAEMIAGRAEVFVTARSLIDGVHVRQAAPRALRYFMPLFDAPQTIYANGMAVETLSTDTAPKADLELAADSAPPTAGPSALAVLHRTG